MKFYRLREEDRQFLKSLLYATGIILFWRGVWEISYELPLLKNVYFAFFLGLFIMTITGYIYKEYEFMPSFKSKKITRKLHDVVEQHKKGKKHEIYYYDDIKGDHHKISPNKIRKIESDFLVFEEEGHEMFIPVHRITRIQKGKEIIWKK